MASEVTRLVHSDMLPLSPTLASFNATDASSACDHSSPIDGSELLLMENYMDLGDALLPYPSPPDEPGFNSIPTTPSGGHASTISGITDNEDIVVAISTSFNLTSHPVKPDLIFSSSDMVFFYAHSQLLTSFSSEAFGRILWSQNEENPVKRVLGGLKIVYDVPDSSAVFNVILHALYGTSPAINSPSFETLTTAVDRMAFYTINPKDVITKQTPLYQLLLTHAPLFPLHLYSLAGRHELEDLAISTSSHLLSYPISQLPDDLAIQMGSFYLKRLFCLHLNRINALKEILLVPPFPHPPTKECDFDKQKALTRAWAFVAAHLAWDARADLSTSALRKAFQSLTEDLVCELCQSGLEKRIKESVDRWARVKPTI